MAEYHELYRRARYYDIVFRRDVGREIDFLLAACHRHAGIEPASLLDIACDPGYHAWEAARRGLRSIGSTCGRRCWSWATPGARPRARGSSG